VSDTQVPLLELRGVSKSFGSVHALIDVDFEVRAGEVMALVGDNGAGKTTLIKCIAGIHGMDDGEMLYDGEPVTVRGPKDAARLGDRDRLPGPRALRQPRRRPEHTSAVGEQVRDPARAAHGGEDARRRSRPCA
jgi:ABC-type glutathione transport system ATPase component